MLGTSRGAATANSQGRKLLVSGQPREKPRSGDSGEGPGTFAAPRLAVDRLRTRGSRPWLLAVAAPRLEPTAITSSLQDVVITGHCGPRHYTSRSKGAVTNNVRSTKSKKVSHKWIDQLDARDAEVGLVACRNRQSMIQRRRGDLAVLDRHRRAGLA